MCTLQLLLECVRMKKKRENRRQRTCTCALTRVLIYPHVMTHKRHEWRPFRCVITAMWRWCGDGAEAQNPAGERCSFLVPVDFSPLRSTLQTKIGFGMSSCVPLEGPAARDAGAMCSVEAGTKKRTCTAQSLRDLCLHPPSEVWIADGAFSSWWMSTQAGHTRCQWESWWSNMSSWDKSPHHHMSSAPPTHTDPKQVGQHHISYPNTPPSSLTHRMKCPNLL